MSEAPQPIELSRGTQGEIQIRWSDGPRLRYSAQQLRDACPCATCREKRSEEAAPEETSAPPKGLPVLSAAEARPIEVTRMHPVGNYAYNIAFSDGHDSGIFGIPLLRELGQPME
jgi:DUF971 family protein